MEYTKKKFIGNTSWMMVNRVYSMIISLIVGALSARYLGPSNYGLLNYGTSIISFFTTVSSLGLASTLVVELVQREKERGKILGTALVFRFFVSLFSFIMIYFIVLLLEPGNRQLIVVTMLQAIAVILNTHEVLLYWFQMRLEMQKVTIASMIALTVTAVWRIGLLIKKASVEFFALSNSITALVTCICVILFFYYSKDAPKLSYNRKTGINLISSSYHFIISGLAVNLYTQLDRIMLGKTVSTEAVGYYSAAMTIANLWVFVPQAIIDSARPVLTEIKKANDENFLEKFKILLCGINMLGAMVGIAILIFGKVAIWILYGRSYDPAVPALMILVWATNFSMIGTARSIWIVTENKNKYVKYYIFIGAIVNVILNSLLIPIWGINGASIATLISQIVVGIIAPYFFKNTREFCKIYWSSYKYILQVTKLIKSIILKHK